ncbi:hypothetical protein DL546_000393 [Coniochaeta pulveracea]|uniref:Autophagy-related protein 28 n=1 Tax=Coniochaeta pulveracea TaxID=177199 RepID=A0A420XY22_9PEZI|nr:hypothetical protein DL546_000393 [Coniochaeta pulveracea]
MMTSRSSYLPRLSFSRGDDPGLPFHNKTSPPIRNQPSEYALDELSPRPEDSVFLDQSLRRASPNEDSSPVADRYTDQPSLAGSDSKTKPHPRGPLRRLPPPIKELQHLLDVQSVGLAANLDPTAAPSRSRSDLSDVGSHAPTGVSRVTSRYDLHDAIGETQGNELVIPVRQPRRRSMGLSAARAALGRNMALLADLKAEEDAVLTAALSTRKKALAQLRRLTGRRKGLVEELRAMEDDAQEPLGQELAELDNEREAVTSEIAELEERLIGLRKRKRWLEGRMEDVKNQKEAGLSGYRNALREVDQAVEILLKRPPVRPLDVEVIRTGSGENGGDDVGPEQSPGGVEFLRLRPERRTIEMARDWWESEIKMLEDRRQAVIRDRKALEEGVDVWRDAVQLVTDFETHLREELKGGQPDDGKGKKRERTPGETMHAQLDRIAEVMIGLDGTLRIAQEQGWNLLICAIGAELEAFKVGDMMLREALRAAGYADDEGDTDRTPQLGRSMSGTVSLTREHGSPGKPSSVDAHDDTNANASESDNEVPPDLLVDTNDDDDDDDDDDNKNNEHDVEDGRNSQYQAPSRGCRSTSYATSNNEGDESGQGENEVPPEFVAEHPKDGKLE